jgi:hypothetical protein
VIEGITSKPEWGHNRRHPDHLGGEQNLTLAGVLDFSTYLRHWLPNRLYDLHGIEKSRKDEEEPDILKTESLQFLSGGNGARLVFDTGVLTVGVRVTGNDLDYLTGTLDRIGENSAVRRSSLWRRAQNAPDVTLPRFAPAQTVGAFFKATRTQDVLQGIFCAQWHVGAAICSRGVRSRSRRPQRAKQARVQSV